MCNKWGSKHTRHSDSDLSLLLLQVVLQRSWFREIIRVPGEVTLPIRVLDIQPDDVVRNIVQIKSSVDSLHVSFVVVVPAALVVPECKQRGQGLIPWQRKIILFKIWGWLFKILNTFRLQTHLSAEHTGRTAAVDRARAEPRSQSHHSLTASVRQSASGSLSLEVFGHPAWVKGFFKWFWKCNLVESDWRISPL